MNVLERALQEIREGLFSLQREQKESQERTVSAVVSAVLPAVSAVTNAANLLSAMDTPVTAHPELYQLLITSGVAPALAQDLLDLLPDMSAWGEEARIAIRAASVGYGLAATIHADSLEEVLDALRRPPVRADDDELSRLGVVLILRRLEDGRRRVAAAHYIRPTARDEHGHVQRLGPAVLATWDPDHDRFEHFGWGVTPELALRVGRKAGDFEQEVDARREFLHSLAAASVIEVDAVRVAIAGYR